VGAATAASTETLTKAERWADARMFMDKTEPSRLEFPTPVGPMVSVGELVPSRG
jgi:hypothetical protein